VSLPAGVFLPYAGVKTNIIFFDRIGRTKQIWYYEVNLERKLTKNKPITYEELSDFLSCFPSKKITENSRFVNVEEVKDYDLSAKNPNKLKEEIHRSPAEILDDIEVNNKKIETLMVEIRKKLV
jgi:type I restriction enzyme M protein